MYMYCIKSRTEQAQQQRYRSQKIDNLGSKWMAESEQQDEVCSLEVFVFDQSGNK